MRISVIIPHFNQPDHLKICLDALHSQKSVSAKVDIIVVDNGSREWPATVCEKFPNVQLLVETTPGPGPARNRGAAVASGDVLAFIDADCHAHDDWLAAIESEFSDTSTHIIGGDVRVNIIDPKRPTFLEPYESIYSYRNEEHIAEGFSGTGNLAVRTEVFRHVGDFAGIGVAEDREWGLRANALGYRIKYVPAMIVYHPARRSFSELRRKWDRHIAHDYEERSPGLAGFLWWFGRAAAVAGSPVVELGNIVSSPRISGLRERVLALLCLTLIRLYRAYGMVRIAVAKSRFDSDWGR